MLGVCETAPVSSPTETYLNLVVEIRTSLEPYELWRLPRLEQARRVRTVRWGPRTLDVDVLLMANFSNRP